KKESRQKRIRAKVSGTLERPRLAVYRSSKFVYAQVINDEKGHTLASAKGKSAEEVGKKVAEGALKKKIKAVVFDRGGYKYHGKVKILADAARAGGLKF
ncbi:MAG: 50S ribosomal protein L18, partial [Patescibacteria group bacterium]